MVDNTEQDDGIIELTQTVEEDSFDSSDQDVIELTDIDTQIEESKEDDLDLDFDTGEADTEESVLFEDADSDFEFGMDETARVSEQEIEMTEPVLDAPIADEPIAEASSVEESIAAIESKITQEQVDAALERVIEKKFAKKIEKILLEVMEKVLEKEIVDIRKRLQKDLDEIAIS